MTLAVPTVHLNGTSRAELIDQLCEAIDAIHAAGSKLAAACPNGRDYYPQDYKHLGGGTAIGAALAQHEARMAKLREVAEELQLIAQSL